MWGAGLGEATNMFHSKLFHIQKKRTAVFSSLFIADIL